MDSKLILLAIVVLQVSISPGNTISFPRYNPGPCYPNWEHNFVRGKHENGESLIFTTRVTLTGESDRLQLKEVDWKHTSHSAKVNFIEILDQLTKDRGGCVQMLQGGLGTNFIKMILYTQRGGGMDYIIRVYGFVPDNIDPENSLMWSTRENLSSKILGIQEKEVKWRHASPGANVTYIEVLDQLGEGKGGCVKLVEGGLGKNYIILMLNSQIGGAFDYIIKAYGFDP